MIPGVVAGCWMMGGVVFGANAPTPPAASTNAMGPKIRFATTSHDFGRAMAGEQVKYTYVFTNVGDQTLELKGVQACGCITSDYTRKVEPGQTGVIPISFNSSAYSGPVSKNITVTSNDKSNSRATLQFNGTVWKAIEASPAFAMFNQLNVESPPASVTVRVVNNLDEPVTLSEPESQNPTFKAELKTIKPGKEFQVIVTTVPPLPTGTVNGRITLKTSSASTPIVTINAMANGVKPVVEVNPAQFQLPGAPLAKQQTLSVNIINNGTNTLVLSDPAVNAPGVDVQLKEMKPGHLFAALLTFPEGFAIARGVHVELNVKSSLASSPVIKVPILQSLPLDAPLVTPIKPQTSAVIKLPPQAGNH